MIDFDSKNWQIHWPEMSLFKLVGRAIVPVTTFREWVTWHANTDEWNIGNTEIGAFIVSTVFLGIERVWGKKPFLFETLVLGNPDSVRWRERYRNYTDAENGHRDVCQWVENIVRNRNEKPSKLRVGRIPIKQ